MSQVIAFLCTVKVKLGKKLLIIIKSWFVIRGGHCNGCYMWKAGSNHAEGFCVNFSFFLHQYSIYTDDNEIKYKSFFKGNA
jgi:hypothetical protein